MFEIMPWVVVGILIYSLIRMIFSCPKMPSPPCLGDLNKYGWDEKRGCGTVIYDGEKYTKEEGSDDIVVTDMNDNFVRRYKTPDEKFNMPFEW